MKTAGLVLDHFDDPSFELLAAATEGHDLPSLIKQAQLIPPEDVPQLPDDAFALVLVNDGYKLRKFACVDPAHTALSCMYFHETRDNLPFEAQKVAAVNLSAACNYFGLPTTPTLDKLASELSQAKREDLPTKAFAVPESKAKKIGVEGEIKGEAKGKYPIPDLAHARNALARVKQHGTPAEVAAVKKKVEQKFPELAERSEVINPGKEKTASRYVDVTDTEVVRVQRQEDPTLLDGRYPVGDVGQIKQAETYFLEHGIRMHPRDRHDYCKGLVKVAGAHGVDELAGVVQEYGSTTYGRDLEMCLEARCEFLPKEAISVLEKLAAVAQVTDPEEFAEALADFDEKTGLNHYWGQHVIDPWLSTLGPPIDKVAEYVWSEGAERTTGTELVELATNRIGLVKEQFGEDLAEEFTKDPIVLFESMPAPHKKILARMANDMHSGGAESASGS